MTREKFSPPSSFTFSDGERKLGSPPRGFSDEHRRFARNLLASNHGIFIACLCQRHRNNHFQLSSFGLAERAG
jgi:hypothetical protein